MTEPVDIGIEGLENAVQIGSGGFAVVYRAEQPAFRRTVAVKLLSARDLDSTARDRFERECQAMGSLSDHPGIVTMHDAGFRRDGRAYMVMAYMQQGTLADRLKAEGAMPWPEAVAVGITLAGALESAHRAEILHRDIKPGNVLISQYGGAQLADFGIARIAGGHETRSGQVTASLPYAPPEVLDGKRPGPQGDIYSLGATIFDTLAGSAAFVEETDESSAVVITRIFTGRVPDLRDRGIPPLVCAAIEKAMAKSPEDRQQSALEFGRDLQAALAAAGLAVTPLAVDGEPPVLAARQASPVEDAGATKLVGQVAEHPPQVDGATGSVEAPPVAAPAPESPRGAPPPPDATPPPERAGIPVPWVVGGIIGLIVVIVVIVILAGGGGGTDPTVAATGSAAITTASTTPPTAATTRPPPTTAITPPPVQGQLASGQVVSGELSPGVAHDYSFSGNSGETVAVFLGSFTGDTFLELVDESGAVFASNDNGGGGLASLVVARLPGSGNYRARATVRTGGTHPYQMELEKESDALLYGQFAPVSIDASRPVDLALFQGFAGDTVSLFEASEVGDSVVQVFDPAGRAFAFDSGATDFVASMKMRLPDTGVYVVQSIYNAGSGPFEVIVNIDDPTLFIGETIIGRVETGASDAYTFFGSAGTGVSVLVQSELQVAAVTLFAPNGAFLASGPEQGQSVPAVVGTLPADGFYTVVIESNSGQNAYSMTLAFAG